MKNASHLTIAAKGFSVAAAGALVAFPPTFFVGLVGIALLTAFKGKQYLKATEQIIVIEQALAGGKLTPDQRDKLTQVKSELEGMLKEASGKNPKDLSGARKGLDLALRVATGRFVYTKYEKTADFDKEYNALKESGMRKWTEKGKALHHEGKKLEGFEEDAFQAHVHRERLKEARAQKKEQQENPENIMSDQNLGLFENERAKRRAEQEDAADILADFLDIFEEK